MIDRFFEGRIVVGLYLDGIYLDLQLVYRNGLQNILYYINPFLI